MIIGNYDVKKQRFNEDTPLVAWVRDHPLLKSNPTFGFVRTDIDMVWYNYNLGFLMFIEEKSRGASLHSSQRSTLEVVNQAACFALRNPAFLFQNIDPSYPRPEKNYYCGLHVVRFENTGPTDGQTWVDDTLVTTDQLTAFFQFKWTPFIQVYRDLAQKISMCISVKTLTVASLHINHDVPKDHPEYRLLATLFNQKQKELAQRFSRGIYT